MIEAGPRVPSPVVVIGTGLLGTSVALALKAFGADVRLRDAKPEALEAAVSVGAGTAESPEDAELVVVAVPPSAVLATVEAALAEFPSAIVTDVASVKAPICDLVADPRYVGGHPMAGKERSGPLAASALLFEGRPWAIVPTKHSTPEAIARVEELVGLVGAVPVSMEPHVHDEAVALVSHVPHLVSVLTAGLLTEAGDEQLSLAGPGLRDVTRIARSDSGMWLDIIGTNSSAVSRVLRILQGRLAGLIGIVDAGAHDLGPVLDQGRRGTQRIPGKHGDLPDDIVTVYVTIDDAPGELSRLLQDTGDVGVNIEDLRIDHEMGRPVGLVEILVAPDRGDFLLEALISRGWAAYL